MQLFIPICFVYFVLYTYMCTYVCVCVHVCMTQKPENETTQVEGALAIAEEDKEVRKTYEQVHRASGALGFRTSLFM